MLTGVNDLSFLDKLDQSDICLGSRTGHYRMAREWAAKKYGADFIAGLDDSGLEKKILSDGYIPLSVNGLLCDDHGVFLIHRDELSKLPMFRR